MTTEDSTDPPPGRAGGASGAISTMMVQMFRDYTGRGPTRAHTTVSGDLVTCVLRDSLTKGEQKLVDNGESASVLEGRRIMQRLMRDEASAGVEKILQREVVAFLSDNTIAPDIAVETGSWPRAKRPLRLRWSRLSPTEPAGPLGETSSGQHDQDPLDPAASEPHSPLL